MGGRNAAASGVDGSYRQRLRVPRLLGSVPFLFADEQPRRLCSSKPPFGLLSNNPNQLGAPNNWSRVKFANRTREHIQLCMRYTERLQTNARVGTRPPLPHNQSCAIVGSGGSLKHSGNGALIDGHQVVMRFNAAPAGGQWAVDVGSRTTLRLFTDKTIAVSAKRNDKRSGGTGLLLYCMATWVGKCIHSVCAGRSSNRLLTEWVPRTCPPLPDAHHPSRRQRNTQPTRAPMCL